MYKIIFFVICSTLCQVALAQQEKIEIDGAIVISNNEDQNPIAGTIRWTGQDFEGFDGTRWKSFTNSCSGDLSSPPVFSCPSDVVLDNCNMTVNWTHDNPASSTVHYRVRLFGGNRPAGIIPGTPLAYPINSKTIDFCGLLGISSGSGIIEVQLIYYYDNDPSQMIFTEKCPVNYNFSNSGLTNALNSITTLDTLEQGENYNLDVDYELAEPGIVYVQFMDANFEKIGESWTNLLPEGPGITSLNVSVNGQLSIGENYVQAQLFNANWGSLAVSPLQYAVTIDPAPMTNFGVIHSSDPALTEYHTVFPIQFNTYEHGNPNPQSKQLRDAAVSNNYYAYKSNWYVGEHWTGPIKAFFGPVSETGGSDFWMEWENTQIPDNYGNASHSETDVRVQKHIWAWGSQERGYPKRLSQLPASVNCTANGQWAPGSSGRAHINMTTWISDTDNIDDPNTQRCDIIIHAWDNSGDMSANNHFNLIGTLSDNGLVYDVIQRPGDIGEKASFNLVPRRDGLTIQQRNPILGDYTDTSPMDFNIDLKQIISKLMVMAVDDYGAPIFDNSWYLSGNDWTITAQSPAVVGGVAIPASKGRWTFNSYAIPNLN